MKVYEWAIVIVLLLGDRLWVQRTLIRQHSEMLELAGSSRALLVDHDARAAGAIEKLAVIHDRLAEIERVAHYSIGRIESLEEAQ